jgi:tRNA(Ile)-lysidine synthase
MGKEEPVNSTDPPPRTAGADVVAALRARLGAEVWGAPFLVGVSGGADSVALVLGLTAIAPPRTRIIVAHAEHDLRSAAVADREFVAQLADRLGLGFAWQRIAVREADGPRGEGLEGRARRLRYRFLSEAAHAHGARHVLVAHTADDQAETILHRILRGTGPAGLAGMRAARELCPGVALLRPLLTVPRDEVRAFLAATLETWREDESNADLRHARNFLRHEILGRCAAGPYPAAAAAIVRLGDQTGRLAAALHSAAVHLLERHGSRHADGTFVLRTVGLAGLDRHLLAEMFVALWDREGWPRRDMTAAHYQRLATVAASGAAGERSNYPGGVRVVTGADGTMELRHPAPR